MRDLTGSDVLATSKRPERTVGARTRTMREHVFRRPMSTAAPAQVPRSGERHRAPDKRRPAISRPPPAGLGPAVQHAISDPGHPLDEPTLALMNSRLGWDFSAVRLHTNASAAASASELGAQAYAVGPDIVLGAGTAAANAQNRQLLAHELAHVAQYAHGTASPRASLAPAGGPAERQAEAVSRAVQEGSMRAPGDVLAQPDGTIQRAIDPEKVAVEMVGRTFTLAGDHSAGGVTLKAGTAVTVSSWANADITVMVTAAGIAAPIAVPKTLLRPTRLPVSGVDPYSAGVAGQAAAVARGEGELSAWMKKKASYTSPKGVKLFDAERMRLERLLATRRGALNRKLIQETMFNRFDATIKHEVDAANTAHGLKGAAALDSNLLKSMLFQESQFGTSGTHLEDPPSHSVKTRFNLAQVIDSSGAALLTLLETEQKPLVTAFGLVDLRKDLAAAQAERAALKKKTTRTPAEDARLATLEHQAHQSWETFIWEYNSPHGFAAAVAALFAATTPARNEDFEFWIHLAVLWLFEKHRKGMSWPDAIRAYNGGGARAEHYREAVVKRAAGARAAAKAGTPFVPAGT